MEYQTQAGEPKSRKFLCTECNTHHGEMAMCCKRNVCSFCCAKKYFGMD